MRKLLTMILIALMACLFVSASAESLLMENTRDLSLTGHIRQYCIVKVYPINASGSSSFGLPFNLMGDDVRYNEDIQNHGRIIATWIVASNYDTRTLTVRAEPLRHETENVTVDYYLILRYGFQAMNADGSYSRTVRTKVINSDNTPTSVDINNFSPLNKNIPILATDESQIIKILLTDVTEETRNRWPDGNYSANVYFEINGGN